MLDVITRKLPLTLHFALSAAVLSGCTGIVEFGGTTGAGGSTSSGWTSGDPSTVAGSGGAP